MNINWDKIKEEYISGSLSQRELAKKHGVSISKLQKAAKNGGWYALKKENTSDEAEQKESHGNSGLSALSTLGNMLADKFALAVEQLGSDGEEIDTNRLRQLVGVMKDLTGIAQNSENDIDDSEKKQAELVEIIRCAVEKEKTENNLAQDEMSDAKNDNTDKAVINFAS